MLTIENHHRLARKPIGKEGWAVYSTNEQASVYEIAIYHERKSSYFKVYLQRTKTQLGSKGVYRFLESNGSASNMGVTADYIGDMNNLLKSLEHFLP